MAAEAAADGAGASPVQPPGGRGSLVAALSSVWSAVVLGLLAAIFAWLWFGDRGEGKQEAEEEVGGERAAGHLEDQVAVCDVKENIQVSLQPALEESLQNIPIERDCVHKDGASDKTCQLAAGELDSLLDSGEILGSRTLYSSTAEGTQANGLETTEERISNTKSTCTASQIEEIKNLGQPQSKELANAWEQEDKHPTSVSSRFWDSFTCDLNEEFEHHSSNLVSKKKEQFSLAETEAKSPEFDAKIKQVAAVHPMPQNVHVKFRVHYVTNSDSQLIAVTGDHKNLGAWETYIPLQSDKDGFWSHSVLLPVDTKVSWKFVMVENGKVRRWEECNNRSLETEYDDKEAHQWWGYH
ncbi:starch-binding domain-containing protein 1 [Rhinatrema bivittatum]|uniref:starch-binding domain-containing protein 1 n=1 Tax=Rhinatrema bivittatum TaxID=194408 RepID=UPI001127A0E2|nr:starch-binding domain-containing protein 1 [Rhinatrema bivittatum]